MFSKSNILNSLISTAIAISSASAMDENPQHQDSANPVTQLNQSMNDPKKQESGIQIDKLNSEFAEQAKKFLGEWYLGHSLKSTAIHLAEISKDEESTFNKVILAHKKSQASLDEKEKDKTAGVEDLINIISALPKSAYPNGITEAQLIEVLTAGSGHRGDCKFLNKAKTHQEVVKKLAQSQLQQEQGLNEQISEMKSRAEQQPAAQTGKEILKLIRSYEPEAEELKIKKNEIIDFIKELTEKNCQITLDTKACVFYAKTGTGFEFYLTGAEYMFDIEAGKPKFNPDLINDLHEKLRETQNALIANQK